MRIVVAGGPRSGKTTFADAIGARLGVPVRHTDALGQLDWSAASLEVATWFDAPGPWIVEGVTAVRALRKWLEANPFITPADRIFWARGTAVPRAPRQEAMAKGCETVWSEILPLLEARGVLLCWRHLPTTNLDRALAADP